jgi:Ca2+-binding EF-hand superfamily protein
VQDEEAEMGLDEDELDTIKEVFKSSERAGTITIKDLRECLTKIGWIGTDAEMQVKCRHPSPKTLDPKL